MSSPPLEQASKSRLSCQCRSHSDFLLFISQDLLSICYVPGTWRVRLQRKMTLLTSGKISHLSHLMDETKCEHSFSWVSGEEWASGPIAWRPSHQEQEVHTSEFWGSGICLVLRFCSPVGLRSSLRQLPHSFRPSSAPSGTQPAPGGPHLSNYKAFPQERAELEKLSVFPSFLTLPLLCPLPTLTAIVFPSL